MGEQPCDLLRRRVDRHLVVRHCLAAQQRRGHRTLELARGEQATHKAAHRTGLGFADDERILRVAAKENLVPHQDIKIGALRVRAGVEIQVGRSHRRGLACRAVVPRWPYPIDTQAPKCSDVG